MVNGPAGRGRLLLVPSPLDTGTAAVPLDHVLTPHALHCAAQLTHWVVENAKSARALLKRIDAQAPLARPLQELAIVELPRPPKGSPQHAATDLRPLLRPLLDGHDVGLLSEAGLPAVADPGALLVAAAHDAGLEVLPLAGASALTLALAASGLNGQSFAFIGYLPIEAQARAARLRELQARSRRERETQLMIETPYRNQALFDTMLAALEPATRVSVSVGLTLPGGWSRTQDVAAWRARPAALPADVPAVFALLA
jgi:16S rRNA (cytidine1402-2'-O)-methyltransferase